MTRITMDGKHICEFCGVAYMPEENHICIPVIYRTPQEFELASLLKEVRDLLKKLLDKENQK